MLYQITRQPVRSSSQPLQLPDGIVVDLFNSGVGSSGQFPPTFVGVSPTPTVPFNPIFTFAPGGSVDYLTDITGTWNRPTGAIYLLVGRRDQMPDATAPRKGRLPTPTSTILINNLTDPDSIWITVGYQTGLVASAENLPPETFTDTNGNFMYDSGESWVDRNGNGHWDGPNAYTDSNMDAVLDAGETTGFAPSGTWTSGVDTARFYAQAAQSMGGR
jgi:hypothetical protein